MLQHSYTEKIKDNIMEYNELGKTGMKLSNLGFGASSLGGVFHGIKENEGIEAVFALKNFSKRVWESLGSSMIRYSLWTKGINLNILRKR